MRQIGRLEATLTQFDTQEQWMSQKYNESLQRNLEGYYAAGFLEHKLSTLSETIEQLKKQNKQGLEHEHQLKEEQHKTHRDLEDVKETLGSLKMTIDHQRQALDQLEAELKEARDTVCLYCLAERTSIRH